MNGYVDDGVHVVDTFFMFSYRLNFESHSLLTSLIYFYFVSLRLCLSSFARCLLFLNGYLAHIERCCFLFRFCLCFYYEVIMSVSMWLCVNEMKKSSGFGDILRAYSATIFWLVFCFWRGWTTEWTSFLSKSIIGFQQSIYLFIATSWSNEWPLNAQSERTTKKHQWIFRFCGNKKNRKHNENTQFFTPNRICAFKKSPIGTQTIRRAWASKRERRRKRQQRAIKIA